MPETNDPFASSASFQFESSVDHDMASSQADAALPEQSAPEQPASDSNSDGGDSATDGGAAKKKRRRRRGRGGSKQAGQAPAGGSASAQPSEVENTAQSEQAGDQDAQVPVKKSAPRSGAKSRSKPRAKTPSKSKAAPKPDITDEPKLKRAARGASARHDRDKKVEPAVAHADPDGAPHTSADERDNQPPEQHQPLNPETFATDKTFDDLGLHPAISRGVKDLGFRHPTHIQAKLIPVFLTGKDILGQAKTGTGKTASFALPLLHMVERGVWGQALILAPTRELAIQIHAEFVKLGKHMPVRAVPIYGGQPIKTQAQKLEKGCEIIVGTPGRLMDMIERRLIDPRAVRFAVLDEVDRMLDIGFREDIRRILKMTPSERQTVMVSATIRGDIEDLARRYMRDPEKLVTTAGALTVDLVEQHYLSVEPWDKRRLLHHLLTHEEPALTLIFCRLKKTVDDLAYYLNKHGIEAHAMHGDMSQSKRNSTMRQLRAGDLAVLIASDLASRGIDVDGITHVINYDLPEDPDLYVHRIGRTARAGRDGVAWAFVTPKQGKLLSQIEDLINAQIPKMDYPDFQPSPRPEGFRDEPTGGRPVYEVQNVGDKPRNRYAEVERPDLPKPAALAVDNAKFPGGIVPTKMPPNRMRGKIKSGR